MPEAGQDAPGRLAFMRARLNDLLSAYEAASGVSSDAYSAAPTFHPMAAGKYISTLVELHHARLISTVSVEKRTSQVLQSLASHAVAPPPSIAGLCWGLGFGRHGLPPDEPYLITSAIVTRALASLNEVLPGNHLCSELREAGSMALGDWCQGWQVPIAGDGAESLPAYSRGIRRPVFNAAAMAWSVLIDFVPQHRAAASAGLNLLWAQRIPGLGWSYEPGSPVIDMLHQAYLYGSMKSALAVEAIARDAASSIGQFASGDVWIDGLHLVDDVDVPVQGRRMWFRLHPPHRLAVDPRRARLWSIGELLVLVSEIAAYQALQNPWLQRAAAIADMVTNRLASHDGETCFARHTMHAAHGLAAYLRLRRALGSSPVLN